MRKREIEKLLYTAVAEALGVEPKAPRKTARPNPVASIRRRPAARREDRAAA